MLAYLNVAQRKLTPDQSVQRKFLLEILSAVLDEDTGALMDYQKLKKKSKNRNLYQNSYAKDIWQLSHGMPGLVGGTNTMFFMDKKEVPVDMWRDATYGRLVVG